jgi:hypothetical protein
MYQGSSGSGGVGVVLSAGGTLDNSGSIFGGAPGQFISGNLPGSDGNGVDLNAGGIVVNGGAGNAAAEISGNVGVYASATANSVVVTNYGTIRGSGGVAVAFKSGGELVVETGSAFIGAVHGGGGQLDLYNGGGTITNLGGSGTVSGAEAIDFSGFGAYRINAGSTWTLAGANTIGSGQELLGFESSALTIAGTLTLNPGGLL